MLHIILYGRVITILDISDDGADPNVGLPGEWDRSLSR